MARAPRCAEGSTHQQRRLVGSTWEFRLMRSSDWDWDRSPGRRRRGLSPKACRDRRSCEAQEAEGEADRVKSVALPERLERVERAPAAPQLTLEAPPLPEFRRGWRVGP
mmetsp:Transcript_12320/g.36674  ORF Transcript_12320/g.36674 Transcript_12320/m.36674 type:complete len:109 (+) Transcript_12320:259-585(+)